VNRGIQSKEIKQKLGANRKLLFAFPLLGFCCFGFFFFGSLI